MLPMILRFLTPAMTLRMQPKTNFPLSAAMVPEAELEPTLQPTALRQKVQDPVVVITAVVQDRNSSQIEIQLCKRVLGLDLGLRNGEKRNLRLRLRKLKNLVDLKKKIEDCVRA
jgi:hypothetical protein